MKKIQADSALFLTLLEIVGEGITLSDGKGYFYVYNSKMAEITGYTKEEVDKCGDFLLLLYPEPDKYSEAMAGLHEIHENRDCRDIETVVRAKNGSMKTLLVSTSVVQYNSDEFFLSSYRDITFRKMAEKNLRKSERQLHAVTSAMGEGVFELDREGRLIFINPAAERLLGWKKEYLLGKKMHDIIHHHMADKTPILEQNCLAMKAIRSGETYRTSHDVFVRRDGEMVPVSHVCTPVFDDGEIAGSVTAFHDITERLRNEEERERLILELQEALVKIRTLSGLLPICASCKKIRNDNGYWQQIEAYICEHSDAVFTHGICSDCAKKLYPEYYSEDMQEGKQ